MSRLERWERIEEILYFDCPEQLTFRTLKLMIQWCFVLIKKLSVV